jgi:hypothetical protein
VESKGSKQKDRGTLTPVGTTSRSSRTACPPDIPRQVLIDQLAHGAVRGVVIPRGAGRGFWGAKGEQSVNLAFRSGSPTPRSGIFRVAVANGMKVAEECGRRRQNTIFGSVSCANLNAVKRKKSDPPAQLTLHKLEVLLLVGEGQTSAEIGRSLGCAEEL